MKLLLFQVLQHSFFLRIFAAMNTLAIGLLISKMDTMSGYVILYHYE